MLTINELKVSYGKNNVLNKLNLNLEASQIHGVVGLNGSGKTTLFNAIYGFVKKQKGSILWKSDAIKRKQIGFLETRNYYYSNITAREHLRLFPTVKGSFDLGIWQDLLKLPFDELIDNYSTGMKKKLAILSIIKLDKPILILDEPFNEIDLETSRILKVLFKKLKAKGKTIIVSSHIIETLINTCDFIHHLENKIIKKTYPKNDMQSLEHDLFQDMENRITTLIDKAL